MLSLYLLYANTSKSTSAKAAPQWIGSPKGTGCTSEVAPTGDGRGNSLSILDCPTTNAPTPATAKQEPEKKPSPLGEGGRREPDGRGEVAYKHRLPQNFATKPNDCRSNKPHQTRKAIQPRKRAPPHRALPGPPPTQRGRLKYSRKASANIQSNHYS